MSALEQPTAKIFEIDPEKQSEENMNFFEEETHQHMVEPLKKLAIAVALLGVLALIFEVRNVIMYSFEIYLSRLFTTVAAFIVLVAAFSSAGKKNAHILGIALAGSVVFPLGFIMFKAPETFVLNSHIIAFSVFTVSLFLGWELKNQLIIIAASFSVIAAAALVNANLIFNLPNFTQSIFVIAAFGLASIAVSAYLYKARFTAFNKISALLDAEQPEGKKLAQPDDKFEKLVHNSAIGIFLYTAKGKFEYVNPALLKMLGYSKQEDLQRIEIKDLIIGQDELQKIHKRLEKERSIENYKINFRTKEGEKITVLLNERLVKSSDNKKVYYEGSIENITNRYEEESGIREELETLKEQYSKLKKESEGAINSNDLKNQFIENFSHKLRTPMNSVIGFLTLIENGLFESEFELRDFAHNAKTSAESLLNIINNILDISQIESGKLELFEEEFLLKDEIEKAKSIIDPAVKDKDLAFNINIEEGIPAKVKGDPTRYRQALLNILNNAVHNTQKGGIDINLKLVEKDEENIIFSTIIKDTGKGIPEDKLPGIFTSFKKLKESSIGNRKGPGLGLLICKEFVQMMGGEIEIKSKVEKGTTVTFSVKMKNLENLNVSERSEADVELTAAELNEVNGEAEVLASEPDVEILELEPEVEISEEIQEKPEAQIEDEDANKKKILLVEDDLESQNIEMKLLRENGYAVYPVASGEEAIKSISEKEYNLILMDVEMEGLDGIAATTEIRKLPKPIGQIPIVAVTAHSSMKDRERCLAAGMDDYISKPININFLKMTIDRWLNERRV